VLPGTAQAFTITWDRNNDPAVTDYQVFMCWKPGCKVVPVLPEYTVPQPPVGTKPSITLKLQGKSGALAIASRNKNGQVSELSKPVRFVKHKR